MNINQNSYQNSPLLKVENLQVEFIQPHQTTYAVRGINFEIFSGETLGILGESGSGKSVTSLSILRLLPNSITRYPQGKIFFKGKDILQMKSRELRKIRGKGIGMIFQEPMTSLNPYQTIYTQIAESLFLHVPNMTRKKAKQRVLELLETTHVSRARERLNAYPHELSGGQRQRVTIAMALANNPDILIADEPTSALDVDVQEKILDLLIEIKEKMQMSILFITHNLIAIEKISDRICVMKDGEIVESGTVSHITKTPKHPYTRLLLDSNVKGFKKPTAPEAPEILHAENVNVTFCLKYSWLGKPISWLSAVKNVSLHLRRGQTLGIVGQSGSGKSTLGKAILRILKDETVSIDVLRFAGQDILNIPAKQMRSLRKNLQVVFQDPFESLSPRLTVKEIIGEGLSIHYPNLSKDEHQECINQSLLDVGLELNMKNRFPHEFSGGQRQRIAIARTIVLRPQLLFLDEPTSALDRNVQFQIVELLRSLQEKYQLTYLFISHDPEVVRAISDEIFIMKNGEVIASGPVKKSVGRIHNLQDLFHFTDDTFLDKSNNLQ